jgi:hypothetical protein
MVETVMAMVILIAVAAVVFVLIYKRPPGA